MPDRLLIRAETPDQPDVRLLAPGVGFFVARDGGQAVGTAAFVRRRAGDPATDGQAYGEVKRMYVDPAYRGRETGIQLLDAVEGQLRSEGFALALLETGSQQTQAVRLYQRCGYKPRAAFGGYPDNGLSVFYGKVL